jgi:hypothetical protein
MSVHADVPEGDVLVRLPADLLIPMDGAQWDSSGDDLVIVRHDGRASTVQRELAGALVAVYNATRKVEWARAVLPGPALGDRADVVELIRTLRPGFATHGVSVADAFVQTRVLRWSPSAGASAGDQGRYLMPVIDLINHHERGAPWGRADSELAINAAYPMGGSQCFVRYSARQDPLDLALSYGFAESSCTLARSVPVTVDVDDLGTVEVVGQRLQTKTVLDPPTVAIDDDRLRLSHVTFDTRHPNRLMGMLQLAVSAFLAKQPRTGGRGEAADLTTALIGVLVESNLDRLEEVRLELVREGVGGATGTVSRAIDQQQRLLRTFADVGGYHPSQRAHERE